MKGSQSVPTKKLEILPSPEYLRRNEYIYSPIRDFKQQDKKSLRVGDSLPKILILSSMDHEETDSNEEGSPTTLELVIVYDFLGISNYQSKENEEFQIEKKMLIQKILNLEDLEEEDVGILRV